MTREPRCPAPRPMPGVTVDFVVAVGVTDTSGAHRIELARQSLAGDEEEHAAAQTQIGWLLSRLGLGVPS